MTPTKGEHYTRDKHGVRTTVEVREVRRRKVVLGCPGRSDSYTVDLATFEKEYRLKAVK